MIRAVQLGAVCVASSNMRRAVLMFGACTTVLTAQMVDVRAGMIVTFKGLVRSVEASGSVDAISQYIAVNDTFTGTFEYDPATAGIQRGTIDGVGTWMEYSPGVTGFSLTFTSGNSSGFSINGISPSLSSMSVADDVLNSSLGPITDLTSGVLWHLGNEFRPGLRQRNLVYRFWDFDEAAMVDSASLADWNADQVFANFDTQSNELAFNSTETNLAQIARIVFTDFSSSSAVPEPSSLALLGIGAISVGVGGVRRRRASRVRQQVAE